MFNFKYQLAKLVKIIEENQPNQISWVLKFKKELANSKKLLGVSMSEEIDLKKFEEEHKFDSLVEKILSAAKNGEIKYDPYLEIHETGLEI